MVRHIPAERRSSEPGIRAKTMVLVCGIALQLFCVGGCKQESTSDRELELLCRQMNSLRAKAGAATQPECASWMVRTRRVDGEKQWIRRKRCLEQSRSLKEMERCRAEYHPQWPRSAPPQTATGPSAEAVCRHLDELRYKKDPGAKSDESCVRRMHYLSKHDGSRRWQLRTRCMLSSSTLARAYKCNKAHGVFDAPATKK